MANERHFYSPAGKTGLQEPENEDAIYWQRSAEGALIALQELTGKASDLVDEFYNPDHTWKYICLKVEAILKGIRNETVHVDTTASPLNRTAVYDAVEQINPEGRIEQIEDVAEFFQTKYFDK